MSFVWASQLVAKAVPPKRREENLSPDRREGGPPVVITRRLSIRPVQRGLLHSEVLLDVPRKMLVDFRVSRDGLLLPGERVEVYVVTAAVPEENAAGAGELPDQLRALHTAISFVR
jgi:hypothetical protein